MSRTLIALLVMFGFAGACLLISRFLRRGSVAARVNEFVGTSVGAFAVGLTFLVLYAALFPQESAAVRNARAIAALQLRVDSLSAVVDSLALRVP